ncbi:DUF2283 domain-containing protein [Massilia sp. DJPM01]|uniref:DUF2283 domain-containing protein n=1 Tax=Massilia sp. DJPM01 TaxID=3024404 RepID=UPI00259DBD38|nr:DUF2283 domain-containing protein [Massilia sp. DJPM01]MDM5179105.1 DUF2283 domain-containing protein [Massilia sp. DJPM01]
MLSSFVHIFSMFTNREHGVLLNKLEAFYTVASATGMNSPCVAAITSTCWRRAVPMPEMPPGAISPHANPEHLGKIELKISEADLEEDPDYDPEVDGQIAYLSLPDHPAEGRSGCVKKMLRLSDLIAYEGADIYMDFDAAGRLIGIEILT